MIKYIMLLTLCLVWGCTDVDYPTPVIHITEGEGLGVQIYQTCDKETFNKISKENKWKILKIIQENHWCFSVYYKEEE